MEIIKANNIEYKAISVDTGVDSISFVLSEINANDIKESFKKVSELSVYGENHNLYGVYNNLCFESLLIDNDDNIRINMRIKTDVELRLEKLESGYEEHDSAIIGLAEVIGEG